MVILTYNLSYTFASFVLGAILLFVVSINYSSTNLVNKRFKYFLIATMVMYALDIITAYTIEYSTHIPVWLNMILNGSFFFSGTIVAILFLYYLVSIALVQTSKKRRKVIFIVNISLLIIYLVTIILNNFIGIYFYFDESLVYSHGPAYLAVSSLIIFYIVESIVFFAIKRKMFNFKQRLSAIIFYVLFFGTYLLQLFVVPNILLSDFGVVIGSFMVFFSIETPDYVKLMATLKELNDLKASLETQVKERTNELAVEKKSYEDLTLETLSSLARVIDAKDHYTVGHSFRVAAYAKELANSLNLSPQDVEQIYFAGLVHDVGKIGISETILTKPGKLDDHEFEIIKSHSPLGGDILKGIDHFPVFAEVARYHHERYDGKGYPDKLKGEDIPFAARIVAICDSFDAMTSDRSYRKALSDEVAIQELINGKGTQFDPLLVDTFLKLYNSYPDSIRNHVEEIVR